MNNKLLSIISCFILLSIVLPVSSITIDNKIRYYSNNENKNFEDEILNNYRVMNIPIYLIEPKKLTAKPIPKMTPDEFNWADLNGKDWTTPATNQKNCGSCWR